VSQFQKNQMNHEDTKSQRCHQDNFVLLGILVYSWFKIQTETLPLMAIKKPSA